MPSDCSQGNFRLIAKKALLEQGLTVTTLARKIGYARNTVSMAIHHPVLPNVRRRIVRALHLDTTS